MPWILATIGELCQGPDYEMCRDFCFDWTPCEMDGCSTSSSGLDCNEEYTESMSEACSKCSDYNEYCDPAYQDNQEQCRMNLEQLDSVECDGTVMDYCLDKWQISCGIDIGCDADEDDVLYCANLLELQCEDSSLGEDIVSTTAPAIVCEYDGPMILECEDLPEDAASQNCAGTCLETYVCNSLSNYASQCTCEEGVGTDVIMTNGAYPDEMSWQIFKENILICENTGPYGGDVDVKSPQFCCFEDDTDYVIYMQDAWGDGWNGGILTINDVYNFECIGREWSVPFTYSSTATEFTPEYTIYKPKGDCTCIEGDECNADKSYCMVEDGSCSIWTKPLNRHDDTQTVACIPLPRSTDIIPAECPEDFSSDYFAVCGGSLSLACTWPITCPDGYEACCSDTSDVCREVTCMKTDEEKPTIDWTARPCMECLIFGPNQWDFSGTQGRIFDGLYWSTTGECGFDTAVGTATYFPYSDDYNDCPDLYEQSQQSLQCLDQNDQESCCNLQMGCYWSDSANHCYKFRESGPIDEIQCDLPEVETTTAPVLCGNGQCDDGEDLLCPTDCAAEVTEAVCRCIVDAGMCDMTCPAILDLSGDCVEYGAAGICGMVIDIDARYTDVCDECPTTTMAMPTTTDWV
eukprot:TRINITY_DN245_c0_g1_i1.p1 TRINITY_DN245_c0_g1~~TRINITY_DN245_c0_g1_i1.p1  ORF type:complete len:715 (+),score=134.76 TRINITY_DN245_c0_g1_i1:249-2147(+)